MNMRCLVKPYRGRGKSSTFDLAAKYKTTDGFIVENHTNRIIGRATLYTTIAVRKENIFCMYETLPFTASLRKNKLIALLRNCPNCRKNFT